MAHSYLPCLQVLFKKEHIIIILIEQYRSNLAEEIQFLKFLLI